MGMWSRSRNQLQILMSKYAKKYKKIEFSNAFHHFFLPKNVRNSCPALNDSFWEDLRFHIHTRKINNPHILYTEIFQMVTIDSCEFVELNPSFLIGTTLERLFISNTPLDEAPWLPYGLKYLTIQRAGLRQLPPDYFNETDMMKMEKLNLEQNQLQSIPDFTITAKNMKTVAFGYNNLTQCEWLFDHNIIWSKLHSISLVHNKIKYLDFTRSHRMWPKLTHFMISNNLLTTLSDLSAVKFVTGQSNIYLMANGNPFHCGCNMTWLQTANSKITHLPVIR